jgi:HEAT repeat protein
MPFNELKSEDESKIYSALTKITKSKDNWESYIPMVGELLNHMSDKIRAKALWQLGEMGLLYPNRVKPFIAQIVSMLHDKNSLIRQRSVCALGRIGRGRIALIMPYFDEIMNTANDSDSEVRMNLIWASENIATNSPTVFEKSMDLFLKFLDDKSIRVRMEAPEIFRVIGKRKPNYVLPYLDKLKSLSENDEDRVVRAHANGAIKATLNQIVR